jgi:iron-sulfur cluster assembly accessory protein
MQKIDPIIQFSSPARQKLMEVLKEENASNAFLRIDVYASGGGCACSGGYKYGMALDDKARPDDVFEEIESIKVVTDKNNVEILKGARIDYSESVQRRGFRIINPNVQAGSCGCGGH